MHDKYDLKIDWATYKAAKYACENWHYTKSMPAGKSVKIGAWECGRFIGVVIFSYGANKNIGRPYGLKQNECCELTRVALRDHKSPVSMILVRAIKLLKEYAPGLRLIVSYADISRGHHGGIYQATNWIYVGVSHNCSIVTKDGRVMHKRQAYSLYHTSRPEGAQYIRDDGKHKYLYPLDSDMRKLIAPLAKPYPKRNHQQTVTNNAVRSSANHNTTD